MSQLGVHAGQQPTNLGTFLQQTHDAGSTVPSLFALDNNIAPDITRYSPTTSLIFRTQIYGPDNGAMYQGDPIAAGRARVDQCLPTLRQNPADWYALDNEPGRADVDGLTWLCNYYLGEMQRADEVGIKLCVGEWSTGMPPIDVAESAAIIRFLNGMDRSIDYFPTQFASDLYDQHQEVIDTEVAIMGNFNNTESLDYISIYTPMLRYAAAHGHILGLHEYSLSGPMIGSPLCLRYRDLYAALPADARPLFAITEAGPGAGYATGYTMQAYVDVVAAYDAEVMRDAYVLGVNLFQLGKGESNMAEVMPLLTEYVATHPTPIAPPPPANEREFDYWLDEDTGIIISRVNPFDLHVTRAGNYKAITRPKVTPPQIVPISVSTDGHGSVTGGGQYAIGSDARLEWKP